AWDWPVHARKSIQDRLALGLVLNARQESVGLEWPGHAGHWDARHGESPEQAWDKAHGSDHVLFLRVKFAHDASQPTLGPDFIGLAGVPNVHGAEMRTRRIEVTDAMHDGKLALVPELFHGREVGREPISLVQMYDLIVADRDGLAIVAVKPIVVRDHCIKIVVAAAELHDDQHGILLYRCHRDFLR